MQCDEGRAPADSVLQIPNHNGSIDLSSTNARMPSAIPSLDNTSMDALKFTTENERKAFSLRPTY